MNDRVLIFVMNECPCSTQYFEANSRHRLLDLIVMLIMCLAILWNLIMIFTENPDNRCALINKITDIEVEFLRRITSIEEYLKIPTSHNVEKPSCGSDRKAGDKESMYVDCSVKTSCASDVNAKNLDNDSMDVDHDPNVVEQQYAAGKNLIDEFEHESKNWINDEALEKPHLAGKNFIDEEDQHASSKNLEVPLELDTLCMNNADSVQRSNDAKVDVNPIIAHPKDVKTLRIPFEQEDKLSKYLQSPYMVQSDSTEQNHKLRARHNKVKKRCLPLTAPDGKVIPT
ncbi:hypothetical protein Tco_0278408 [Tanacetum coccineum]